MSDQQVLEWLESEVGQMDDAVPAIEDTEVDLEETIGFVAGMSEEITELRHAVLVD